MTKDQRQLLMNKIQLCKEGKIGASDVVNSFDDILNGYIDEAIAYTEDLEKKIGHWRNKTLQSKN